MQRLKEPSRNRTRDLPSCSTVPQPTSPPLNPKNFPCALNIEGTPFGKVLLEDYINFYTYLVVIMSETIELTGMIQYRIKLRN
jgi:hypothetical protein